MKLIRFMMNNRHKKLTLKTYLLTGYYRLCILLIPFNKLKKRLGSINEESIQNESNRNYKEARLIQWVVEHVAHNSPWDSKCMVQAWTAQRLLRSKNISSTLYLGVGKDDEGKMIAHAWIRSGQFYVTGGNGEGYAIVARFRV
ncbi:lasso peptide biosynthesis B2 protein [Clostridium sp. Marseille-P299]|uniref:lasso peptide biosynthesis B2 protein n=1 Tax=Clostridium sp. Marseille-P299 TaxID=1805477 RepID=UPI000832BFDF|nr:lasso peptide biosynthesis B2 protein [Clostridium sp. Marseille-P299]